MFTIDTLSQCLPWRGTVLLLSLSRLGREALGGNANPTVSHSGYFLKLIFAFCISAGLGALGSVPWCCPGGHDGGWDGRWGRGVAGLPVSNCLQSFFFSFSSCSSANKCLLKVATYAAQLEQYQKAIEIYEQVQLLLFFFPSFHWTLVKLHLFNIPNPKRGVKTKIYQG